MYNILEGEEKCEDADIITWTPDGSAFIISDTDRFEKEVIPLHFGNRILYRSFQRKVCPIIHSWKYGSSTLQGVPLYHSIVLYTSSGLAASPPVA